MTHLRTPTFLMANLGSEVSRLLDSKEKGDVTMVHKCLARAHVIVKQITDSPSMNARMEEIRMLNDVIDDVLREKRKYQVDSKSLRAYFYPFASRVLRS